MYGLKISKECMDNLFYRGFEFDIDRIFQGASIIPTFVNNEPNFNTSVDILEKYKHSPDIVIRAIEVGLFTLECRILEKIKPTLSLEVPARARHNIFHEYFSVEFTDDKDLIIKELYALTSKKILLKPAKCPEGRVGFTMQLYFDLQDINYELAYLD